MSNTDSPRSDAEAKRIVNQDATITERSVMDHNREEEVSAAVDAERERLAEHVDLDGVEPITEGDGSWDWVVTELSEQGETNLSDRISALVERVQRPYPSLVRLAFDPEEGVDFVPGQYVRISYDEEEPRVYSIASSPNAEGVELCVRRVPGGELTPDLCERAEVGDSLFVRGPYGDEFTLHEPSERDMAFIATGTGVAPFKSMIDYVFEEGLDGHEGTTRDVWLFLGSGWEDHLPYREAFRELDDAHDNFHFVPTLSREEYLTDWEGETDYVQQTLLKYLDADAVASTELPEGLGGFVDDDPACDIDARIDPSRLEVYVCGIGAMAEGVADVVRELGLDGEALRMESYG